MPNLSKRFLNECFQKRQLSSSQLLESLSTRPGRNAYDVFLSYSFKDKEFALKICKLLEECGYSVYIDLNDEQLDRSNVDRKTAQRLATMMKKCSCLIYLHTASATVSKWCPWELGFMSGYKNFRCVTIPLTEDKEEFPHQEYLEMYPTLSYEQIKGSDKMDFWVDENDSDLYVNLRKYINGTNPYKHSN